MRWTFTDSCMLGGTQAQVKLFDETNGGGWPAQQVVALVPYGQQRTVDIGCIPGAKICFGAEDQTGSGIYWGVSLANNQVCTGCCATCGAGDAVPQNLICM